MDLETALIESCDVYFYEVSQLIGIDNIAKTAKKLGLGQLLDFDLPVQTEGVVPTKDWKFGTLGHKWKRGETLVCSIGQGFVQTTPLQNAVMLARVINCGYAVTPRLMRMIVDEDGNPVEEEQLNFEKLDIDPVHMEFLKRGTDGVTMDERGTARGSRILEPGMSMGGKTGTAQVRRITLAERATGVRTNEELPWKERDHALFVGYGPIEKPRYVVSVIVEHGGGGSSVAAPIARDIMAESLRLAGSTIYRCVIRSGYDLAAVVYPTLNFSDKLREMPWTLFLLLTAIAGFGFLMLYSAANGDMQPWSGRQMMRFGVGAIVLLTAAFIDIRLWLRFSYHIYGLTLLLLVAVEIKGSIGMGAQRWLNLGFFQLQPSELMKVAVVLALGRYFQNVSFDDIRKPLHLFIPLCIVMAPAALVLRQPDLGTAVMLLMGAGAIFFVSGVRLWKFGLVIASGIAAVPIVWQTLREYQQKRILTFLEPEKQTDFIFTMLAVELGLAGGLLVLSLYVMVLVYGFIIAYKSRNQFGRLISIGIITNFFLYIFINVAMVMGGVPVVGVPLPLISYGGTAMLTVMFSFGILMSAYVHREMRIQRTQPGMD